MNDPDGAIKKLIIILAEAALRKEQAMLMFLHEQEGKAAKAAIPPTEAWFQQLVELLEAVRKL